MLTGAPDCIQKDSVNEDNFNFVQEPDPFLLHTTTLDQGEIGRAIVLAVGEKTVIGS